MQDSRLKKTANNTINSKRLDDLMAAIDGARDSFSNWEEKRTQAMISLDSFSYDIKMIDEERRQMQEVLRELRRDAEDRAKIYQSQIGELTDQMQLLKLENENLRNDVISRELTIETHQREILNQKELREQSIKLQAQREHEIRIELETKSGQKAWELQVKNEGLAAHLEEIALKKIDAETRNEKLERELIQIRSQMLNVLRIDDSLNASKENPGRNEVSAKAMNASEEITSTEAKRLRAVEVVPSSVGEYLKRLGY